jgi:glycosyltransferase involved in cell wall biosynthesis
MNTYLLSLVTVCYNDCDRLAVTIGSVAESKGGRLEYLVVDGGSGDGTVELLAREESRGNLVRWVSEPDRGIYDAMNKGLALSTGKYVHFLNAGDELIAGALGSVMELLQDGVPPLVFAKVAMAGSLAGLERERVYGRPPRGPADFEFGMPVCHQGIFYRRDALGRGYDLACRNIADRKLTFEIVSRFGFDSAVFLDEVVARYAGGNLAERRFGLYMADELRWAAWFPGSASRKAWRIARLLASFAVKLVKRAFKRVVGEKFYARLKYHG